MKRCKLGKRRWVSTYGCTYSKADMMMTIGMLFLLIGIVCYLQNLQWFYIAMVWISLWIMLPFVISSYFMYNSEKRRFEEYCLYFESMRMYFKVYGKLNTALKLTHKLFDDTSSMAMCLEQAIMQIEESADYALGLACIEKEYENPYLKRLHALLITGEKQGGDSVYYNLDLIEFESWKNSVVLFQKKKRTAKHMFFLMTILSFGISVYSIAAYQDAELQRRIVGNLQYQLFTFVEIEALMMLFLIVYMSLMNKKWLRRDA